MKIKNVLFVAAVCVLAALTSCGGSKKGGLPDFGDDEFAVATIGSSSAALQTTYPATIKGIQDVEVRPKVSGFITKVFVHEGQTVSAGQALFSIDSETYQAAVRSAAAAVNTAKAQANTAKLTYQNNKKLYDSKIIGEFELSTAANSLATAQAQVAQAEASLASAREQLAWCTVTSPSAGVVGSLPFKVGALVSASGQALTTVSNISTMEVFFSLSESQILNMSKTNGSVQAAIASFPAVKLQLADGSIYNHPGKVVKMSGVIDATTGSISLIAHFPNPEKLLKSGGAGSIVIPNDHSNAIVIPQEACSQVQDKIFVYAVTKDNKVKYSEIKVNPQDDGKNYIVTSGLHVGDRIVLKGITKLTDGQQIKPITLERYNQKISEAAKLSESQDNAHAFATAMGGKK
ncbi:MAG: efflux RND transporter periplasmic adaptor subunit [Prevotella sp.]|nr:efflux RND transporter periplasmic adaptor subunit [Prevotella sp.]